jgi:predicted permease
VDDELEFHLEMRARELAENGLPPRAARLQAERRFRDLDATRRECRRLAEGRDRDERRREWWTEVGQDLGFALRQAGRTPLFTAVVLFTLALGIGATTAIFSVYRAVVLAPLPFPAPERLHLVAFTHAGAQSSASAGNFLYLQERQRSFAPLSAVHQRRLNLSAGGEPERVLGAGVSHGFFDVFGLPPVLGRTFLAEEDQPGRERVVVLSHGLWRRRFGGDPAVLGREMVLSGIAHQVVGVMPPTFDDAQGVELWVPIAFTPERRAMFDEHYLQMYGRLRPGVSLAQARSDLERVARDLARDHPRENEGRGALALPLLQQVVGDSRESLGLLLGAVALVFLIACANVANLLLGRSATRERELALRAALGAGQGRIIRQLLTESALMGLLAAALGLAVAEGGRLLFLATAPPGVPRLAASRIDWVVLLFAAGLGLAASLAFGLAPALAASRVDLRSGLGEGGRAVTRGRDRARRALVAAEVGLTLTLLVGAGLLIRTGLNLTRTDLGFQPNGVVTARFGLAHEAYPSHSAVARAFEAVLEGLRARPGIDAAALVSKLPLSPGRFTNGLVPDDRPFELKSAIDSDLHIVTPGYFEAMRIPMRAGRALADTDRRGAPKVMVINEELARLAFPGQDAIGRRVACCEAGEEGPESPSYREIVGVVANVAPSAPGTAPNPQFYLALDQAPEAAWDWTARTMSVVARTSRDPEAVVPALREAVRAVDAGVPLYDVQTMVERRQGRTARQRFGAVLLSGLGLVGLVLAGVGIYGVVAYWVSQRTREIAVRLALGAAARDVVGLVVRQGLLPVAGGLAIGLVGAVAAGRALRSFLFGVGIADPRTLAAVAGLLFLSAAFACALPARRAARVDPARSLAEG